MTDSDLMRLVDEIKQKLADRPSYTFAVIGCTPLAYDLVAFFRALGAEQRLLGVYSSDQTTNSTAETWKKPLASLRVDQPNVAIIASDSEKELLIESAAQYLDPKTNIMLVGYGHFAFRDDIYQEVVDRALVPSLANGYPNVLVHIYQCLKNAARLSLGGVVVECGAFKGGTTMILSHFIERVGASWPVIAFDTFQGFPEKKSVLDMYNHRDCALVDEAEVRRLLAGRNIKIVPGDINDTIRSVESEEIVLAFIDTDNFSSASAVLDVVQDNVVPGGAIIFDHFTGRNRFLYTLGERLAAKRLLLDERYFNLHDTGVFFKQR